LQKQFGSFRDMAVREPVSVTHHGRDSLVILSADEYVRLKALDSRQALHPRELPDDLAEALEKSAPPAFTAQFDHEVS
jgi:PHD/YefM family antitoxin component YafN of YafNO toxin-antitoxin module